VNIAESDGTTEMMAASEKGHHEVVKALLEAKADVNGKASRDLQNYTALMWASENGHAEVVGVLIAAGAQVHAVDSKTVSNSLMKASREGHVDVVRALIAGGADVNSHNVDLDTPLSLATDAGHQDVVEILKSAGGK